MSSDWVFPTVPPELKSLAPYFQRAQELKVKDAAMAYWCTYYGIQQGITTKAHNREARPFLFQAMSILEQMKVNLGDNEAVSDDEVGAAYIENFALRVFNMADNEDRREQATRSTAKKFLASANFFELLHIFDKPVGTDIEEKIRYAKWKAADLAKAFREGRKPIPGDANAPTATPHPAPAVLETVPLEAPQEFAPSISAWSPGTSLAPSPAVRGTQSLEPSPVVGADVPLPPTISDSGSPPLEQPVDLTSPEQTLHTPASSAVTDTPRTPSPRAFDGHLNLHYEHEGFVTPGMWSTMATPGTDDVYKANDAMSGIDESPSWRMAERKNGVVDVAALDGEQEVHQDVQDDRWSMMGNMPISRQNSWTVGESPLTVSEAMEPTSPSPSVGLHLEADSVPPFVPVPVVPVKKVHFSPSVIGGLSSTSSSVTGSPPASPEGYAPSLPTVDEVAYSSDSEREAVKKAHFSHSDRGRIPVTPFPIAGSLPQASPEVYAPSLPYVQETANLSDSDRKATGQDLQYGTDPALLHLPDFESPAAEGSPQGVPPVIHKVPSPTGPLSPSGFLSPRKMPEVLPPLFPRAPPQIPSAPSGARLPGVPSHLSPQPPPPPALHPTPRFVVTPLANGSHSSLPKSPSPPPDLTSTQISRIQKHCRFAISALDYEDAETARKELRAALAMLGD